MAAVSRTLGAFLRSQHSSYLHGVGADYFSAEPFPDLDRQLGLARAGGSQNHHQRRDHGSPHGNLHASRGRRHDAAAPSPS